jgi:hypothetical protein
MSEQRQKNRPEQEVLAFPGESRSDAPKTPGKGTETLVAKRKSESLAGTERLMEKVCELENSKQALQRVKANKGSPGVDGMTVEELPEYLKQHGPEIGEQLRNGSYQPQPVRRVEILKPDGSGVRKLGIQQKRWDPTFSEHSHGLFVLGFLCALCVLCGESLLYSTAASAFSTLDQTKSRRLLRTSAGFHFFFCY